MMVSDHSAASAEPGKIASELKLIVATAFDAEHQANLDRILKRLRAQDVVGELEAADVPSPDISIVTINSDAWYEDGEPLRRLKTGAATGAVVGGAGGLLTRVSISWRYMESVPVARGLRRPLLARLALPSEARQGRVLGAPTNSGVSERHANIMPKASDPAVRLLHFV